MTDLKLLSELDICITKGPGADQYTTEANGRKFMLQVDHWNGEENIDFRVEGCDTAKWYAVHTLIPGYFAQCIPAEYMTIFSKMMCVAGK